MLLGMSDNFSDRDRDDFRRRLMSSAERDQQEIQDWLNGSGGMVMAVVTILIAIFIVFGMFS